MARQLAGPPTWVVTFWLHRQFTQEKGILFTIRLIDFFLFHVSPFWPITITSGAGWLAQNILQLLDKIRSGVLEGAKELMQTQSLSTKAATLTGAQSWWQWNVVLFLESIIATSGTAGNQKTLFHIGSDHKTPALRTHAEAHGSIRWAFLI